ncbi:sulfatase family protein [Roseibacillus persicicus]|uniref:sulfatase family protein n=1 Tax=Roseibacillus persicicus TaxID=454148 RepID=UPI0028106D11|nr:sulfatase [Roseibacillus persicicus]MDQ8189295.1 sulfatase [Roseibacillus persicicus]
MKRLLSVTFSLVLPLFAEKPNIVLIFCDDLGYTDLSCQGATGWKTPNIDRLAGEGIRFTDFHVSQAVCSASRASLLTGCYANRIDFAGALGPKNQNGLHDDEVTLGEICQEAGYATAAYGKWHLGHHPQYLPIHHGFDDYFGFPYSNDMWPSGPIEVKGHYPRLPLIEDDEVIITVEDQTYMTKWLTERSVRFIRKNHEKPFFLYLAHPQPHVPLYVSPERQGSSEQGLYGDVIQEIDWSTGEILRTLEELGLADNTWVIFTSDNGPWMTYGNHGGTVGPLRGSKGTSWEGGVRVPCVMRWPSRIQPGQVRDDLWATIDILPTFAALLDVPLPEHPIDGVNAWPMISGEKEGPVQEAYFYYYGQNNLESMRMGPWKLIFPHKWRDERSQPGKDGLRGTYLWPEAGLELYNLEDDIAEFINVIEQHPDVVARMQKLAEEMRADLGDDFQKRKGPGRRTGGRLKKS